MTNYQHYNNGTARYVAMSYLTYGFIGLLMPMLPRACVPYARVIEDMTRVALMPLYGSLFITVFASVHDRSRRQRQVRPNRFLQDPPRANAIMLDRPLLAASSCLLFAGVIGAVDIVVHVAQGFGSKQSLETLEGLYRAQHACTALGAMTVSWLGLSVGEAMAKRNMSEQRVDQGIARTVLALNDVSQFALILAAQSVACLTATRLSGSLLTILLSFAIVQKMIDVLSKCSQQTSRVVTPGI